MTPQQTHLASGPIVVKVGGKGVADTAVRERFVEAVAGRAGGHPGELVIVHGGGAALSDHLDRLGIDSRWIDGLRVSPARDMPEIAAVLAGKVNSLLVAGLLARGVSAVGMRLGDGKALATERIERGGPDVGEVGVVVGGTAELVRTLLAGAYLPVLSSIGIASDGSLLNVNADDAAAGVARSLGARLLAMMTDVPGIRDARGELIQSITPGQIESLIGAGVIAGGMIPKSRAAAHAATTLGIPVLIASYEQPGVLGDLETQTAGGTWIVSEHAAGCGPGGGALPAQLGSEGS